MGNDMTWEQKCRISALRAACASRFWDSADDAEELQIEADDEMTERILHRAELFRTILLRNGPMDLDIDDDHTSPVSDMTKHEVCPGCGSTNRKNRRQVGTRTWSPLHDVQGKCDHNWHQL